MVGCGGGGGGGCHSAALGLLGASGCSNSNEVDLSPVAGIAGPVAARTQTALTLDGSGSRDPEGRTLTHLWELRERPAGSNATLSSERAVKATLTPDLPGRYVVRLTVNDGRNASQPADWVITVSSPNAAPISSAGADLSAVVNTLVTLNGTNSRDPDGDPITYLWSLVSQPAGSRAVLADAQTPRPKIIPDVSGAYVFSLTVQDGQVRSIPSFVTLTSSTANLAPVAAAGSRRSVVAGTLVGLDGSGSQDPNGDLLVFNWTLISRPSSSNAVLLNPNLARPDFVPDAPGDYVFSLTVSDGQVSSPPAFVTINATSANVAPTAVAGSNQSVLVATPVILRGEASSDPNGDLLTYRWTLISRPNGSAAALTNDKTVRASLTPDQPGDYVVGLVVNDGKLDSSSATVTITASMVNAAPVADAGVSRSVITGAVVSLSGLGSTDANQDRLGYDWRMVSRPAGSVAALRNPKTAGPDFVADLNGDYVVSLIVNDGKLDSAPAFATITATATNATPRAVATGPSTVRVGQTMTFNGNDSFDPNGDRITFQWTLVSRPNGSAATLSGSATAPVLNTPVVSLVADVPGVYVASLVVTDLPGLPSTAAVVSTNATANAAPIANPGPALSGRVGATQTLKGSDSRDPDGDTITFAWTVEQRPVNSDPNVARIIGPTLATPIFIPDAPGLYVFSLTVRDSFGLASAPVLLQLTVTP